MSNEIKSDEIDQRKEGEPHEPEKPEVPRIDTQEALYEFAQETTRRIEDDTNGAKAAGAEFIGALEAVGMDASGHSELQSHHELEVSALRDEALEAIARETGEAAESERVHVSLWEKAQQWRDKNTDRIATIKKKKEDGSITKEYGKGAVNLKFKICANNPDGCAKAYLERRAATGREALPEDRMERVLDAIIEGKPLTAGADVVLMEEMTQELAYADYQQRKEAGDVTLGAEGIAADMMVELDLELFSDVSVETMEQSKDAVQAELQEYVEKGYINEKEARLIMETVAKFGEAMLVAFEGKRFPGDTPMTKEGLTQRAYEGMRDNARKIAYQTKLDKRVFSGSDHGTRHICEGCTHFSEQMMASMKDVESIDFKPQDEVLIRQIIIDHDIGYTTEAAQAKGGFEASKDHPCAGCDFVESNKDYYVQMYGTEGYDIIRDVVLNHSYAQSEYQGSRPDAASDEVTYNRDLIRSVVSTVDAMGVTSETKAMDMFRHPEAINLLQDVKLYLETHGGAVDDAAMDLFKGDMNALVDQWLSEEPPRISQERARGYRSAIEPV